MNNDVQIIATLRRLADSIEHARIDADSIIVIITAGDVHTPVVTRQDRGTFRQAMADANHLVLWKTPGETPQSLAQAHAAYQAQQEAERLLKLAATPHVCLCLQRFRTAAGLAQHVRTTRRVSANDHGRRLEEAASPFEALPQEYGGRRG